MKFESAAHERFFLYLGNQEYITILLSIYGRKKNVQ